MAQTGVVTVSEEIRRGRNRLAITVVLGHAIKHMYNSGLQSVILAVMKDDLGLTATQFGLLSTSGRVTSGATTMVAGYLGDRFANRSGCDADDLAEHDGHLVLSAGDRSELLADARSDAAGGHRAVAVPLAGDSRAIAQVP